MKKLILVAGLLFSVFASAVNAQSAAANTTTANTAKSKQVSPNPGKAITAPKPAIANTKPRTVKPSPNEQIKVAAK